MLTEERNRVLTQVGRGTPMGELMRRYWHPVAAVAELDDRPIKLVRLMGEDLVLYRDLKGNYGLVGRRCPHRGADLTYGIVEDCGIRCSYHGWHFDQTGQCLAQPFDDTIHGEKDRKRAVRITAYPVEAKAGLLWAYLGPSPAPLLPNWEPFTWKNGFVQIIFSEIPCNWVQCQENSVDPVHLEWAHDNWSARLKGGSAAYHPRHVKLGFDEFDYGIIYRRVREDTTEDHPLWKIGRVCLWPNALFASDHFEWRVPVDDTHTLNVTWVFNRVPKDREPYLQNRVPYWYGPIKDPRTGGWITSHVENQDFIAWVGQGAIADRTRETLSASDRGIAMMRKRFFSDLEVIAGGGDPKAVIRDPAKNVCIELPVINRHHYREGLTRDQLQPGTPYFRNPVTPNAFIYQAGQPEEVRRAYEEAMGIKLEEFQLIRKSYIPNAT